MLDIKTSQMLNLRVAETSRVAEGSISIQRHLRRIRRHQMILENQRHDQQRRGEKAAHRSPQPGPERQRDEYRERVELEPAADDGRGDKMSLQEGNSDKRQRRNQAGAERGE